MNNKIIPELIEKAKKAQSAEELLALAREHNIELTEEEAAAFLAQLNPARGELSDDELDNVAGGGCATYVNGEKKLIVTHQFGCSSWNCKHHFLSRTKSVMSGGKLVAGCDQCGAPAVCANCAYMSYNGVWYCDLHWDF